MAGFFWSTLFPLFSGSKSYGFELHFSGEFLWVADSSSVYEVGCFMFLVKSSGLTFLIRPIQLRLEIEGGSILVWWCNLVTFGCFKLFLVVFGCFELLKPGFGSWVFGCCFGLRLVCSSLG
jgi:hypothetical protein